MNPELPRLEAELRAARAELEETIERTWQKVSQFQRDYAPTEQEYRDLHDAADRGQLGDEMRELARRIERGEDSWDAVLSGQSSNSMLLATTLDRSIAAHHEAIAQAFEEDETFDPSRPDPDD